MKDTSPKLKVGGGFWGGLVFFALLLGACWLLAVKAVLPVRYALMGAGLLLLFALCVLPDAAFSYLLTEETVTVFFFDMKIAVVPWEQVHWMVTFQSTRYSEIYRLTLFLEDVERPAVFSSRLLDWLTEEQDTHAFTLSEEYIMSQVLLVCCPNPPLDSNFAPERDYAALTPDNILTPEQKKRRERFAMLLFCLGIACLPAFYAVLILPSLEFILESFSGVVLILAVGLVSLLCGQALANQTPRSFAAEVLHRRIRREHPECIME